MANTIPSPQTEPAETIVEMGRMSGLSDGVYAIALTLLVLDIKIPEDTLAGDLSATLVALAVTTTDGAPFPGNGPRFTATSRDSGTVFPLPMGVM